MLLHHEASPAPIGHNTIDSLRELDTYIQMEDDVLRKRAIFQNGIACQPIDSILGKFAKLNCNEALASSVDLEDEKERMHIERPIDLLAAVANVGFMHDDEFPVSAVVVVLYKPKIFGSLFDTFDENMEPNSGYRVRALRIPVLAINSWLDNDEVLEWLKAPDEML